MFHLKDLVLAGVRRRSRTINWSPYLIFSVSPSTDCPLSVLVSGWWLEQCWGKIGLEFQSKFKPDGEMNAV